MEEQISNDEQSPEATVLVGESSPSFAINEAPPVESAPSDEWLVRHVNLILARLAEQERINSERERIIDRQHEENQRLKQGELLKSLMPMFRDLTRLFDDLNKTAQTYASREPAQTDAVVRDWYSYAESVSDILYRYGVETIPVEQGGVFEPKTQRAVSIAKTGDPNQDRTVARVLRNGFTVEGKVLRTADVQVFRYEASRSADSTEPISPAYSAATQTIERSEG